MWAGTDFGHSTHYKRLQNDTRGLMMRQICTSNLPPNLAIIIQIFGAGYLCIRVWGASKVECVMKAPF